MTNPIKKPHLDLLLIKKINKLEAKAHNKKMITKSLSDQSNHPKITLWNRFRNFFRKLFTKNPK